MEIGDFPHPFPPFEEKERFPFFFISIPLLPPILTINYPTNHNPPLPLLPIIIILSPSPLLPLWELKQSSEKESIIFPLFPLPPKSILISSSPIFSKISFFPHPPPPK